VERRDDSRDRFEVKSDLASTLVQPGQFTEPGPGLTVYAQSIDRDNHPQPVHPPGNPERRRLDLFAARGRDRRPQGVPVLIMRKGSNQQFSSSGVLQYTSFDEYTFDLSRCSRATSCCTTRSPTAIRTSCSSPT
jgi:lipopolysaccharide export system permease protein